MRFTAYFRETFALNAKLKELREYSFVTFGLERIFLALQQLSPLTWFIGSRKRAHDRCKTDEEWEALTKRRGKQVELYIPVLLTIPPSARRSLNVIRWAATETFT